MQVAEMKRKITFTLDDNDVMAGLTAHARKHLFSNGSLRRLFLLWAIVSLLAVLVVLFNNSFGGNYIAPFYVVIFILVYAVIVVAIPMRALFIVLPKRIKAAIGENRTIGMEQVMIWDDKALAVKSRYIKGTYPWRMIHHAEEFPEFLALYLSVEKFNIIPKRALDDAQLEDLRIILAREVNHSPD